MPDRREPVFFLSYAHTGGNRSVERFFADLSRDVAELVDLRTGAEPGFMDRRSIRGGDIWTGDLLDAVGTCRVFVALLSTPYMSSRWCGMEWYAFAQRYVEAEGGGSAHGTGILPVTWAPWPDGHPVPSAVDRIQRFAPDELPDSTIADLYREHGLLGLSRIDANAYESVVWLLARAVANIAYHLSIKPLVLRRESLHNIFQESS